MQLTKFFDKPRWAADLDLLGPHVRPGALAWALLLGGALAVAAMSQRRGDLEEREQRAQSQYEHAQRLQRALVNRTRTAAAVQAASAPGVVPAADARSLQAAARLAARLSHPWPEVFAGIEQASDGVALLRMDHDSDSGIVQIDAAVRDDQAAWRFVEALAADGERFAEAELTERQPLDPPQGEFGLRVRVQVKVAERRAAVVPASAIVPLTVRPSAAASAAASAGTPGKPGSPR